MTVLTLAERIENERIEKSDPISINIESIVRNKNKYRFDLAIQRNLRWTEEQKTSLIESILLGYPIPAVYCLRSNDKDRWMLDGKQRLNAFITFVSDEWELADLQEVYGINISGLKFSQLPSEFQKLITSQNITFYQFDSLTTEQRDQLFKRLNSGTPLSKIELIRSILGTENLEYIDSFLDSSFMKKSGITDAMKKGFKDQELILQVIGLLTGRTKDTSGKTIEQLAVDLRINGLTETEKEIVGNTFKYLSKGFSDIEDKKAKKALKKADIVAVVMCAKYCDIKPETFANLLVPFITTQKSGSPYGITKGSGSTSQDKIQKRIEILRSVLRVDSGNQDMIQSA
jgi:hypothetical protein